MEQLQKVLHITDPEMKELEIVLEEMEDFNASDLEIEILLEMEEKAEQMEYNHKYNFSL